MHFAPRSRTNPNPRHLPQRLPPAPAAAATVAEDAAAKDAAAKEAAVKEAAVKDAAAKEAAAKQAADTDALIKKMRARGYKPVNRNGTLVFCRDEREIGSHFKRTRCSTIEQLKDAELSGKEFVNSSQQQGSAVPFKGP